MKKVLFVMIMILFVAGLAEAKIYVALDKSDGTVKGTVDIDEKTIGDWAKQFVMIEAGEDYRGKDGFELKFEGQKLRKATKKEIDDYNDEQAAKLKINQKKKALEILDITEADLEKIKDSIKEKPIP